MKKIAAFILMALVSSSLLAVIYATTEYGEKVVLYEDGTWELLGTEMLSAREAPIKVLKSELEDEFTVSVKFKNVSYKTIKALRFRFVMYDDFGTELWLPYSSFIAQSLKNFVHNAEFSRKWEVDIRQATSFYAYPIEVVFEDGTKWVLSSTEEEKIKKSIEAIR
ncbi:MAG: hypothetical protein QM445_07450 [Thermotogota bacterium]|nr:hypothetical protein [Thermotogota bacterium]